MKLFQKITASLVLLVLLVLLVIKIYFGPWLVQKIKKEFRSVSENYIIEIDRINLKIIRSSLEFEGITLYPSLNGNRNLRGEISLVTFTGINFLKAIFKNDILIRNIVVSNSSFNLKTPFKVDFKPVISPVKIEIESLSVDKFNLEIENDSTGRKISLKDWSVNKTGLHLSKLDTINAGIYKTADFHIGEISFNSADNIHSSTAKGISYHGSLNTITIDSLLINPTLNDYGFASKFRFQKNRFEAVASGIFIDDFHIDSYLNPRVLASTYIRIGEINTRVFQDKRKEFRHSRKPTIREMICNLPLTLRIDSISIARGKVSYKVHAEEAKEPGMIIFNELNATIYNLTNDTAGRFRNVFMEIKAESRLMGKGKFTVLVKGKLSDKKEVFSVKGTLSDMNVKDLDPILENNAFIYATGKIDSLNFNFTADRVKARGRMKMLYHNLEVKIKDTRIDDTTSFRARLISFFANRRIIDSNPVKGEEVRIGNIDFERDPERFPIHYYFKSILTGIGSTISKNEKTSRKLTQK